MVWLLDLVNVWRTDPEGPLKVVQLLSTTVFGAVAVSVFLSLQLPRIIRPRMHCCFLISDSKSYRGYSFLGRYEKSQEFTTDTGQWLHIRITNVSTITYHGLSVTCRLPEGWIAIPVTNTDASLIRVTGRSEDDVDTLAHRPRYFRTYDFYDTRHVVYGPNSDPRETGSASSAVYSFYAVPPKRPSVGTLEVHLISDEAVGATVAKLRTLVKQSMEMEGDRTDNPGV